MFSLWKLSWVTLSPALYMPLNITFSEWIGRRFQTMWTYTLTLDFPRNDMLSTCYHILYRSSEARELLWLCIKISLVVLHLLSSLLWISWVFFCYFCFVYFFFFIWVILDALWKWKKFKLHRHTYSPRLNLGHVIFWLWNYE